MNLDIYIILYEHNNDKPYKHLSKSDHYQYMIHIYSYMSCIVFTTRLIKKNIYINITICSDSI